MTNTSSRRCAVYTRKSSEEGLEQNFNSLQAQRDSSMVLCRRLQDEADALISAGLNRSLAPQPPGRPIPRSGIPKPSDLVP
jgi:hypothetical protein